MTEPTADLTERANRLLDELEVAMARTRDLVGELLIVAAKIEDAHDA